jgi:hypothetical protein
MVTFGSSTQIVCNGHHQSPSIKRVKIRVPFAVVALMVVIQSNLIHFLDVHAVVRPVLFGWCVCFGCVFNCPEQFWERWPKCRPTNFMVTGDLIHWTEISAPNSDVLSWDLIQTWSGTCLQQEPGFLCGLSAIEMVDVHFLRSLQRDWNHGWMIWGPVFEPGRMLCYSFQRLKIWCHRASEKAVIFE